MAKVKLVKLQNKLNKNIIEVEENIYPRLIEDIKDGSGKVIQESQYSLIEGSEIDVEPFKKEIEELKTEVKKLKANYDTKEKELKDIKDILKNYDIPEVAEYYKTKDTKGK